MAVSDYRDLIVWQKAMGLVEAVYKITANFPREEIYGLTSQVRRASVSIPSNIAEGQGRRTTRDFLSFLSIAHGSLKEVETQIMIAKRLQFICEGKQSEILELTTEVGRLISDLANSLKKKLA
jgi:four helix bundle protein